MGIQRTLVLAADWRPPFLVLQVARLVLRPVAQPRQPDLLLHPAKLQEMQRQLEEDSAVL